MRFYIYIIRIWSDTLELQGHFGTLDIFRNSLPIVRVIVFSLRYTYLFAINVHDMYWSRFNIKPWQIYNQNVLFICKYIIEHLNLIWFMLPTYKLFIRVRYILHKLIIRLYYAFLELKSFLLRFLLHAPLIFATIAWRYVQTTR